MAVNRHITRIFFGQGSGFEMSVIKHLFILLSPRRVNYAEKLQIGISPVFNVLYSVRWNIDGTLGPNLETLLIYILPGESILL